MAKLNLIISDLRRRIQTAGFKPGDKIPTQKQLAKELSVSVDTIGQAMVHLQEEGVVVATRGKGTVVNTQPQNRSQKSKNYGLLTTFANINDPMHAFPVKALQNICAKTGHQLHILPFGHSRVTRAQLKTWAKNIDACFVLGRTSPDFVQAIGTLGKPVIFYGEFYREPCPAWAGQFTIDVEAISILSLQHLKNLGHEKILLLRSSGTCYLESLGSCFDASARHLQIDHGFRQFNINPNPKIFSGTEVIELLRNEHHDITAIIVDGGLKANRMLHSLTQNNIQVPEDISLFALNGVESHLLITPDLSRIEPMTWRLGEKLLGMADAMIESGVIMREYAVPYLHSGKTCRLLHS